MAVLNNNDKAFLKDFIANLYIVEKKQKNLTNYQKYSRALLNSDDNLKKSLGKPGIAYSIQMVGEDFNCYGNPAVSSPYLNFAVDLNERLADKPNKNYCKPEFTNPNGHDELLTNDGKSLAKKVFNNN